MRVVRRRIRHGGRSVGAQNRAIHPSDSRSPEEGGEEVHLRFLSRDFRQKDTTVEAQANQVQRINDDRTETAQGKGQSDQDQAEGSERWTDRVQRVSQSFQEEEISKCSQNSSRRASYLSRVRG